MPRNAGKRVKVPSIKMAPSAYADSPRSPRGEDEFYDEDFVLKESKVKSRNFLFDETEMVECLKELDVVEIFTPKISHSLDLEDPKHQNFVKVMSMKPAETSILPTVKDFFIKNVNMGKPQETSMFLAKCFPNEVKNLAILAANHPKINGYMNEVEKGLGSGDNPILKALKRTKNSVTLSGFTIPKRILPSLFEAASECSKVSINDCKIKGSRCSISSMTIDPSIEFNFTHISLSGTKAQEELNSDENKDLFEEILEALKGANFTSGLEYIEAEDWGLDPNTVSKMVKRILPGVKVITEKRKKSKYIVSVKKLETISSDDEAQIEPKKDWLSSDSSDSSSSSDSESDEVQIANKVDVEKNSKQKILPWNVRSTDGSGLEPIYLTTTLTWKFKECADRYYYGQFDSEGLFEGEGVSIFTNGERHEGKYENGVFEGKGRYSYNSGDKYEGQFKNGKESEYGTYIWKNGNTYTGTFENDFSRGKGVFVNFEGQKYEGEWKDYRENGKGTFTDRNGDKYKGKWKRGLKHGKGEMIFSYGMKEMQRWKNGKLVDNHKH